jgi:methylated-DNA-protein-cysteine methyltransferase related protein
MALAHRHQFTDVLSAVRNIPRGQTASYGDVAEVALGRRAAARTVGWALARCPADVPWWRVIYANGVLPGVDDVRQTRLLRSEGVRILELAHSRHGRVFIADVRSGRGRLPHPFDNSSSATVDRGRTNADLAF